jgi:hypothetical protein
MRLYAERCRPSWGVSAWNVAGMQEREATVCLEFSIREKSTSVESAKIKYRRLEDGEELTFLRIDDDQSAYTFQGKTYPIAAYPSYSRTSGEPRAMLR